ncbi:MAG: SRPBCC family protein [Solirubrobacteraceae bacterium]
MTDAIERELELPTTPSELWHAVTDPAQLRGWLADEVSLELRPGGDASFVVDGQTRRGWVEEATPPDGERGEGRLAFWWAEGDEPASRVELTVTPVTDGARLRVRETRPLHVLDLVGIPLGGPGPARYGPAMVAA